MPQFDLEPRWPQIMASLPGLTALLGPEVEAWTELMNRRDLFFEAALAAGEVGMGGGASPFIGVHAYNGPAAYFLGAVPAVVDGANIFVTFSANGTSDVLIRVAATIGVFSATAQNSLGFQLFEGGVAIANTAFIGLQTFLLAGAGPTGDFTAFMAHGAVVVPAPTAGVHTYALGAFDGTGAFGEALVLVDATGAGQAVMEAWQAP